ncbi:Group II intron-encoded protein LtrA [Limosilactobacillus reuteri]|nr:Group II intron-encoded protein LtrA [Limosilactobacillus reuteri]
MENRKYTRARSTGYGEGKGMSVTIQDLVLDRNNLNQAYLRVKRNKGAAGIDDMTVNDLLPYLRENKMELIASLREGKYKPAPVKRVEIPKPNGGVRRLGIPTVVDRMVQQAVAQFLEKRLKVKVNPDKTKVGSPLRLKFLGFSLGVDHNGAYARPAKQSQQRVKKALKLLTKRNRGISLTRMFEEIHRKMRGWLQYYSIGKLTNFIQRLDKWLRVRIRQYIWKQWKKFKTKVTNLQKLGLSRRDAYVFASTCKDYWRTAHSKTLSYSLTNRKLEQLGLMNMSKTLQSIQCD